jgi:predicted dehydrogenase
MDIRVAVIGLGKLGLLHAGLANGLPGSRLVAVADPSSTALAAVGAHRPDVRTYSNHRELLAAGELDAVVIATPTGLHVPVAIDCVRAGIPVFIEKPLSISATQARPLLDALAVQPVVNMVGYMGRYAETFEKAKAIVSSGALGKLQMLRCSMYVAQLFKPGKGWRYDKEASGGGVLMTQNSHVIDQLYWLFGDIATVSAQTRRLYSASVEDHAHLFFTFKSGLAGFMDASWSARHVRVPTIRIHVQGERGTLDVDDDEVRLFLDAASSGFEAGWSRWQKPDLVRGVTFDIGGPHYTRQMEAFLAAVRRTGTADCTVASAYRVQQLIDAAYQSAEGGGAPVVPGGA